MFYWYKYPKSSGDALGGWGHRILFHCMLKQFNKKLKLLQKNNFTQLIGNQLIIRLYFPQVLIYPLKWVLLSKKHLDAKDYLILLHNYD